MIDEHYCAFVSQKNIFLSSPCLHIPPPVMHHHTCAYPHLEYCGQRFDETGGLDAPPRGAHCILSPNKHGIPKRSFPGVLHFGEVEKGPCPSVSGAEFGLVVEVVEAEVYKARRGCLPIDFQMCL